MSRSFLLAGFLSLALPLAAAAGCSNEMEAYPDSYAGIGVELEIEARGARVTRVINGGSASAGGLQGDDLILKVGEVSARGKTLASVVEMLRGPVGTPVEVTVQSRRGEQTVSLTRRAVTLR